MTSRRGSVARRGVAIGLAFCSMLCRNAEADASVLATAYRDLHLVIDSVGTSADEQAPRLRAFSGDKPRVPLLRAGSIKDVADDPLPPAAPR